MAIAIVTTTLPIKVKAFHRRYAAFQAVPDPEPTAVPWHVAGCCSKIETRF
jgi:lysozyme family protein